MESVYGIKPEKISIRDYTRETILGFLEWLETKRGNSLQNECEFKDTVGKGATIGTLFGLMSGFGVGVLLGLLNSFDVKDRLILEIQFLEDGVLKSLFITENKNKLQRLTLQLEDKINSKC